MSQPAAPVDICNLTLDCIGQRPITSILAPTTVEEMVCARHYDQVRREVLRKYIFNFARKFAVWTKDNVVTPAFGFSTAYALPNDFLRLLALGDVTVTNGALRSSLYDLSDGYLYCDEGDSANNGDLDALYTFDAQTVAKFDPLFIKVLKLELAAAIVYKFTLKSSTVKDLVEELKGARLEAAAVAGQEKPPSRIQRSRVRDVRRSGGIFRNNTVI